MKRLSLPARQRAANKAQENPFGALVVFLLFLAAVLLSARPVYGRSSFDNKHFTTIDAYARACPTHVKTSLDAVAIYLKKATFSDIEKARSIYVWLTAHIRYDDKSYNSGDYADNSAEAVLRSKKAVCAGFADLYTELGLRMGLQIKTVIGYAKGFGYSEEAGFDHSNHAWNAIQIDGKWRIFDATWGEGYGVEGSKGELVSVKKFDSDWFDVEPEYAIFSHYPENPADAFLTTKLSLSEYVRLPYYTPRELYAQNKQPYLLIADVKRTKKNP
ncbi:MAG: hypothetical protein RLZZ211_1944 [Bacteroidota bacterium]|jgi:transglutaminase/protease-like cytokinesis protein 3